MGPGQAIYERFGHNAICVQDHLRGTNLAFNYGLFDMGQSGFILRFLQGRMWYWVEAWDTTEMAKAYKAENRSVWVQQLNLTPSQRIALYEFLLWNSRPANRFYRYDYYTDNCSTRVRDALDAAVGKEISRQLKPVATNRTYRWHTRLASQYDPLMYTALYFVLGPAIDRPISAWDESYLPMQFQQHLRSVTIPDATGQRVPLVANETTYFQSTLAPLPDAPAPWLRWYLMAGVGLGSALAGLGLASPVSSLARWAFAVASGLWSFVMGFAGAFSLGAWLLTTHVASYRNENLLQMCPLSLALVVLAPGMVFAKAWARRASRVIAGVVAGTSLVGLLLKATPWATQVNAEMIALALPTNLAMACCIWHLSRREPTVRNDADAGRPKRKD